MKQSIGIFALILALFFSITSCNKINENIFGGESGTEQGEGPENGGSGEAGNESGTLWNKNQTADEIVNGIRLILKYDPAKGAFVGTMENLNTTMAPQARVEAHIFDAAGNSTEYGPTTPTDLAPGQIVNVILPTPGAGNFVKFNMHPEVGAQSNAGGGEGNEGTGGGEGNEGSGGGEGNEGSGGGEGNEGGSGSGEAGNESGTLWDYTATADETVKGIRLILKYDPTQEAFIGTLENINTTISPKARVEVHIFDAAGKSTEYGPTTPADLAPGEIRTVTLPTPGAGVFVNFNMHPEVG
jgi:hypothetical protein